MPISLGAAYAAGVTAAALILKAEEENALLNGPSYIKDGVPRDFTGKLGQQLARRACLAYSNNPSSMDGAAALKYEGACRPYLDAMGAGSGPRVRLPFRGGQCTGVPYGARYTWKISAGASGGTNYTPAFSQFFSSNGPTAYGPITNFRRIVGSTSGFSCGGSTLVGYVFNAFNASGVPGVYGLNQGGSGCSSGSPVIEGLSFERLTGTGECGNPPVDVTQPTNDPTPNPTIGPIIVAPDIDIDASVNVTAIGQVVIDLGLGPVTIDPFADEGGDGTGGSGRPPGDVGLPGLPSGAANGAATEGTAPAGKVLTGLRLNYTATPPKWAEVAPSVYRAPCYVYMGTESGLDMDFAGSLVRDNQFIFAEKDNLTRWRVVTNKGFSLTVTPFYGDPV